MRKLIKKNYIYDIFCLGVLCLILMHGIKPIMLIHNATDEFGYWTAAANFLGWDWSYSASQNSYYGFGLGLFLAPFLKYINDPSDVYKASLYLNILFVCISYMFLRIIVKNIIPEIRSNINSFICFAICCYCANIYNAKITMVECLLSLLFIIVVCCCLYYFKTGAWKWLFISFLTTCFMMCLHLRAIGIFISLSIIIILDFYNKRHRKVYSIKHIIFFLFGGLLIFVGHYVIKSDLVQQQYILSDIIHINDVSGQSGKLKLLLSMKGLEYFIVGCIGRIFYLGYASLYLAYFGVIRCYKKIKKWREEKYYLFYLFLILTILIAISISAVFMLNKPYERTDTLYYGRYSEYVIAPFLILGIAEIFQNKKRVNISVGVILFQGIITMLVIYWKNIYNMTGHLDVSIPAFFCLLYECGFKDDAYLASFMIGNVFLLMMLLIFKGKDNVWKKLIVCILCAIGWFYFGFSSYNVQTHNMDEDFYRTYKTIVNEIDEETDIYYCYEKSDLKDRYKFSGVDRIQFCLKDKTIVFCEINNFMEDNYQNSIVIVLKNSECNKEISNEYTLLDTGQTFVVYKSKED